MVNEQSEDGSARPDESSSRVFQLIRAVAHRDADLGDIASAIREEGFDTIDVLVEVLARSYRLSENRYGGQEPIDVRKFSRSTAPELVAQMRYRPICVPFVLNGTQYDPEDIGRFDGSELHFVSGPNELVAFDDRAAIARVMEISLIEAQTRPSDGSVEYGGINPSARGRRITPAGRGSSDSSVEYGGINPAGYGAPEGSGPWYSWPDADKLGTYFYEDAGPDWGEELLLRPNRAYTNLRTVGRGFLGLGDWNDVISAFQLSNTSVVALYEHKDYGGRAFIDSNNRSTLSDVGWNDLASTVATW